MRGEGLYGDTAIPKSVIYLGTIQKGHMNMISESSYKDEPAGATKHQSYGLEQLQPITAGCFRIWQIDPNHKEVSCIPREVVRYLAVSPDTICQLEHVAS